MGRRQVDVPGSQVRSQRRSSIPFHTNKEKIHVICEPFTFSCHCLWWQLGTTEGKKGWTHGIVNGGWGVSSVSCCNHTINHTVLSGYWAFSCLSYEQWGHSLSITTRSFNIGNDSLFSSDFFFSSHKNLGILIFTLFLQAVSFSNNAIFWFSGQTVQFTCFKEKKSYFRLFKKSTSSVSKSKAH